jgi:hypothetical protein
LEEVTEVNSNATNQQRLENLIAACIGETTHHGHTYPAVFFTLATIPGIVLKASLAKRIMREKSHTNGTIG